MRLLPAKADLHEGAPEAALEHAAAAVAEDGSGVEEWIALVEAHFRKTEPMSTEAAEALGAFEGEIEGTEGSQAYFRALALAEILSGQTDAGLHTAESQGLDLSDPWRSAVVLAKDDAFLRHAVPLRPESVAPEVATEVARRLEGLGFPDSALVWLEPIGPKDDPERRRIAARAEFARGDAGQSLTLLEGLEEPEDEELRARGLVQLGRIAEARTAYQAAGLPEEALRLAAWEEAWPDLQGAEAPLWAKAVTDSSTEPPEDAGPLARGSALLEASAASRASIEALLAGVSQPGS